jgi:hypothetical protein
VPTSDTSEHCYAFADINQQRETDVVEGSPAAMDWCALVCGSKATKSCDDPKNAGGMGARKTIADQMTMRNPSKTMWRQPADRWNSSGLLRPGCAGSEPRELDRG